MGFEKHNYPGSIITNRCLNSFIDLSFNYRILNEYFYLFGEIVLKKIAQGLLLLGVIFSLSGCIAATVISTAVDVTTTVVGGAVDVVDTVTPDIIDDEE